MNKKVAVLMGGFSAEREVSLSSGRAVVKAIKEMPMNVVSIDVQNDLGELLFKLDPKPDVVFNALHGRFGEDGRVQAILDMLEIPYTHSGVLASALAMNKVVAKRIFNISGIRSPKYEVVCSTNFNKKINFKKPYVLKPINEGSSVGVHIVKKGDLAPNFDNMVWPFGDKVLVEEFINGRELTVSIMGDRALAVTEIKSLEGFYDYNAKYKVGGSEHITPAQIEVDIYDEALRLAKVAHDCLGCRGVTRADFRFDGEELYIMEVNTQPGLTPTSLVPEQAAYCGISFNDLVTWMIDNAECDA